MSTTPDDPGLQPAAEPPRGGSGSAATVLLLTLLALVTWALPLRSGPGFCYDDREAIVSNPVVDGSLPLAEAFRRDYWHHLEDAGHYRPLATVLLRLDHTGSDAPSPLRFRLTNVLLHGLVVALLGWSWLRIARRFELPFPWFGLGVLAVHPAGADVVAWISGRTSLVSALGATAGLLALTHARRPRGAALAVASGTLLALLGKEDGVVLAAVLPLMAGALLGWRALPWGLFGAAAALGLYAFLRHGAFGQAFPSSPSAPLANTPLGQRLLLGAGAWNHGLEEFLLFWNPAPPTLPVPGSEPESEGLPLRSLLVAAPLLAAAYFAARPRPVRLFFGLALVSLVACIAPLSQLVPAGELFAPRFLYQPMVLGAFALAWCSELWRRLLGRWTDPVRLALLLALAVVSVLQAAPRYHDRLTFWESHLPALDGDARVLNAVGQARQEAGDLEGACAAYGRAMELDPGYGAPWSKLAELHIGAGDLEAAEAAYRRSIELDPDAVIARANLGSVLLRLERPGDAVLVYREAVERSPGLAPLHRGLARALLRTGDTDGARTSAERALQLDPSDASTLRLLERLGAR